MIRAIFLSALLVILAGCNIIPKPAFIQNRNKEYLYARSIPPISIPPGLASEGFSSNYPVPNRYYPNREKEVDLTPPGL